MILEYCRLLLLLNGHLWFIYADDSLEETIREITWQNQWKSESCFLSWLSLTPPLYFRKSTCQNDWEISQVRTLCYPLSDSQLFCSDKNWIMLLNRWRQLLWERVDSETQTIFLVLPVPKTISTKLLAKHNQNYFQGNKAIEVKRKRGS